MSASSRFGPLKERPFRLLWIGRTGSSLGDSLVVVAIPFAVLRIGGGATQLGAVLAAYTLGRAGFVMAGGVWADRLPRRAVMIGADLVRFGTQATTAALLFTHSLQVWELAVLQATAGAAGGFFVPASTALVPRTISAGLLQQANALLSLSQSATSIFGPAVSGAIVSTAGPAWVFAIDAGSFLFSVAFLFALRVDDQLAAERKRFWHDLADGWHELRRVRWITAGFLGFALGNVGIGMFFVLGPLVAREHLGGAAAWGVILTAGAVGGVVGGVFAYRFRPQRPVATAFCVWSLGIAPALALVPPLPLAVIMVANGVFTASVIVGNTLWETSLQREVRPERLARVGSIDWMLSLCLMPAGQALAGPISGSLGVRGTLVLAGALMCVPNLLVVAFVREVREVRRPEPEAAPAGWEGPS
jgi:MFS family permease